MYEGRYYTYSQFFNIMFYMIFIILLVIMITNIHYRNKKVRKILFIEHILITLTLTVLARFLELVVYDQQLGMILRVIECFSIPIIFNLAMHFFESEGKKNSLIFSIIYIVIFSVNLIYKGTSFFVVNYTFQEVKYSRGYFYLLIFGITVLCALIINDFIKKEIKYKLDYVELVVFALIQIPIIIYIICIKTNASIPWYLYLGFVSALSSYWIIINYMPTYVATKILDGIEKKLDEIILIADEAGNIINVNNHSKDIGELLHLDKVINVKQPYLIFKKQITTINQVEDGLELEVVGEGTQTFIFITTELKNKNKLLGYMYVIKETTSVTEMVIEVINKKEELQEKNKALTDYADVAYKYQMEKTIQNLVKEINQRIGFQMMQLSIVTERVYNQINNEQIDASKGIDEAIKLAKENLQDVRTAVSEYRSLYGGTKND